MPVTVGTDSYIDESDAANYASDRGWSTFIALTTAEITQLLLDAAIYLDRSYSWKGSIATESQALSWPRTGVEDHEGRTIASDSVPTVIGNAQIEIAYLQHMQGAILTSQTQGEIESVKAGPVSVKFMNGNTPNEGQKIPHITRLLAGLYVSAPGQKVANVSLLKA